MRQKIRSNKKKEFFPLPEEYRNAVAVGGKVESLFYDVCDGQGDVSTKHLLIYLPPGYDELNQEKRYNVLYLMHGGGEDENLILGGPGENKELKNIIDQMINRQEVEPFILVTPTFYGVKNRQNNRLENSRVEGLNHVLPLVETEFFHEELITDIVPFIESKYHSYATSTTMEGLVDSRKHRAFGGFSMGSVTTWNVLIHCLDYFAYFMPLSGDCWALAQKAEGKMAKETSDYIVEVIKKSGYVEEDYALYCGSGKKDIAYPNMKPQMDALQEQIENFYFLENEDGEHTWHWINQFIYNILPDLFR